MQVRQLKLSNFRCFESCVVRPAADLNFIVGDNASGKTSVLEALYLLGRGQTFRQSSVGSLIRHNQESFVVHGALEQDAQKHSVGVQGQGQRLSYRLDGHDKTTRYDLVATTPMQWISPDLHHLMERGPSHRRKFLDWGVFHVEHHFFKAWRQYSRVLRQRNRALKERYALQSVTVWDAHLEHFANIVDRCREQYMQRLRETLPGAIQRLLGAQAPEIEYWRGWKQQVPLADVLQHSLERDMRAGYTTHGPHRADVRFKTAGAHARGQMSRGQQKALIAALLLTQAKIIRQTQGVPPILLIDDIAAELGETFLQVLMAEIKTLECQAFFTFLKPQQIPAAIKGTMFHVEQGVLQ